MTALGWSDAAQFSDRSCDRLVIRNASQTNSFRWLIT